MARKYEIRTVDLTEDELRRRLSELEGRYGWSSTEFLHRYNSGELGDDREYIRWAGLLRTGAQTGRG